MSSLRERRLGRMASAQDVLSGSSTLSTGSLGGGAGSGGLALKSPLAHVKSMASALPAVSTNHAGAQHPYESHTQLDPDQPIPTAIPTAHTALPTASAVPAPNFNLFRSASVYSTDSDASDLTFLSDDMDADTLSASSSTPPLAPFSGLNLGEISGLSTPRPETPTTPRGVKPGQGYFDVWAPQSVLPPTVNGGRGHGVHTQAQDPIAGPSRVSSLPALQPRSNVNTDEPGDGQETPKKSFVVRSRPTIPIEPMAPLSASRTPVLPAPDAGSVTTEGGYAVQHIGGSRSLAETHGQVSKLVQGVAPDAHAGTITTHLPTRQSMSGEDWESIHGEQGSEWGDDPVDTEGEAGFNAGSGSPLNPPASHLGEEQRPTAWLVSNPSAQSAQTSGSRRPKRNIVIPRRAAPPPPPGPGTPQHVPEAVLASSASIAPSRMTRRPSTETAASIASVGSGSSGGSSSRQALQPRWPNETETNQNSVFDPARLPEGLNDIKGKGKGVAGRQTHLAVHTDHPGHAARPGSASSGDASYMDGHQHSRSTALPLPDMRANGSKTPSMDSLRAGGDTLLAKGLDARSKGDLAKAAWCYRQSADAGNSTGRMYWGLALKHGWGVARDDNKAFKELQQACDDALADEGMGEGKDRRESIIHPGPKKAMSKELSMGISEMANCFLNGTGVKKSPDAAVSYLRFAADMGDVAAQEQLGFLFSKGAQGIKKDMHEAARWYRMAINQGSTNTIGLAWVWKDKYNE